LGDTDPINATLNEIVLRLQIGAAIIRMQLSLSLLDSNWRFTVERLILLEHLLLQVRKHCLFASEIQLILRQPKEK